MSVIAALYVHPNGPYYGLEGVDPWPESRDARRYAGPYPVVAHPPCSRWCRFAGLVEAQWGRKRGEDDGCFEAALSAVRRWGGVLEHPAYSDAWGAFGLNRPPASGGWVVADFAGGWACHVEQGRYGHLAKKATWLYAHGCELPSLRWGSVADQHTQAAHRDQLAPRSATRYLTVDGLARDCNNLSTQQRIRTPTEFRDELLALAKSAR